MVSEAPSGATVCAVIGDPVEHSVSPAMHTAGYRSLGLKYYFGRLRVTSSELARSMAAVRSLTIRGVSVTLPHKVAVMQYLDEIDPVAQQIGAVNTIVNTSGHLKGYNTDWEGAMRSVEEVASIAGKTVVMIGAGGAARGVGYGFLQRLAGRLIILNRSEEKAKALAGELGAQWGGLDQLERSLGQADILFQTTSVGMHPDILETIVPQEFLHPGLVVVEAVFNPLETRLIREAKAAGCKVSLGYRMLLYQGVRQFELYTGVEKAPVEAMDKALVETLKNR
ncbi:shikimate dehydrogenase [Candidatus Wirthbacteria bacterium CG2_30_54_11]|uniref:Shikimate dehydrogenase (NADP(+)) n=1 Tax=Candidatus Wirthbacteria bacterium CG2_30_54_11 TaxID=1817892 RepID=A0A1J5IE29_9BACT|nr:MAG: shikimate dehydrogenase [Candidatus Wirthbacteria bacterium CG2_30_54_11]